MSTIPYSWNLRGFIVLWKTKFAKVKMANYSVTEIPIKVYNMLRLRGRTIGCRPVRISLLGVLILFCAMIGVGLCTNEGTAWTLVGYSAVAVTVMNMAYLITAIVMYMHS